MRVACIHLPDMAVQAVLRERFGVDAEVAIALAEGPEERRRIASCTALSRDCGVVVGQSVAAARGVCPELIIVDKDLEHELEALGSVADALGAFGPVVSLALPDSVLVDTTGVRAFGADGDAVTGAAIREVVEALGFEARIAIASTPFAAMALASHGARELPAEPRPGHEERRAVQRLPLAAAHLPPDAFQSLHVVGIRTVGAFMALPAASLARRFGGDVRRVWREAHGQAVRRLVAWEPDQPVMERSRHDEEPVERLEAVAFALKALVDRVLRRLKGRGLGAEELLLTLLVQSWESGPRARHVHTLDLGRATDDAPLLLQLLRERLQQAPPAGPVERLELTVTRAAPLTVTQLDLFGDPEPPETIHSTVARLAAILGNDGRMTPTLREDYRPEQAWHMTLFEGLPPKANATRGAVVASPPPGPRPCRLLRSPEPLPSVWGQGPPPGAESGPERLVSGWWDGNPMARDYWVIADRWGRRSWIYRDLASDAWFLHGQFD
ncbi:MAG: protein ImuB [Myxococcota bacterium]|jgi:protein ImuB